MDYFPFVFFLLSSCCFRTRNGFSRRVLGAQPIIWGLRKLPAFKHLPQVAGRSTRIVQTTLLLVMTPLVLAVGMCAVVVREVYRHGSGGS